VIKKVRTDFMKKILVLIITCFVINSISAKEVKIFEVNSQDTEKMESIFSSFLDENSFIKSDTQTGKIIVEAELEILDKIDYIYQNFVTENKPRQIMIEARIVEVGMNKDTSFGFEWELNKSFSILSSNTDYAIKSDVNLPPVQYLTGGTFRLSTITSTDFDSVLNLMYSQDNINIVSNPRLFVLDGREADILIGQKIPYKNSIMQNGTVTTDTIFKEVGIKLSVKPEIIFGTDNLIRMLIKPEISNFVGWSPDNAPIIDTISADTEVIVKNDSVVAIGGLIKADTVESFMKVPVLGDLPFLGKAFKRRQTERKRKEIVIFLIPKIQGDFMPVKNKISSTSRPASKTQSGGIWQDVSHDTTEVNFF